jgi:hypothetical protein
MRFVISIRNNSTALHKPLKIYSSGGEKYTSCVIQSEATVTTVPYGKREVKG